MKDTKNIQPPLWAERFLAWYCKPDLLEDLQGDLHEYFDRNVKQKGVRRAKVIYVVDVFKFFRLYTIRKPEFINLLIQWIMIGSYLKTSVRSITRNKLFSAINIVGLAISMSVGLLMISFVNDLLSFDGFHEKKDRIYRITTLSTIEGQPEIALASTSVAAGKKLKETMTGVEDVTILQNNFNKDASVNDKIIPVSGLWADHSFFKVFTFPLLNGNASNALKEPFSLVLTEKLAKKLFGGTDALGKVVRFDSTDYTVTGVMKDVPQFSHMQFELLASFATLETTNTKDADGNFLDWANVYSNYVYLTIPETATTDALQLKLSALCEKEDESLNHQKIMLSLQPLMSIALGKKYSNQIGPFLPAITIWILGGLTIVVILSACFNYTNLSIARAMRRSREVGIRKVIGALRRHVLSQFIFEATIISLLSLLFSIFLFLFLRGQFLSLNPFIERLASLELSMKVLGLFLLFAVLVGLISGLLPALFFSRVNAIQVLKDSSTLKVFRHVAMRKILVVVQYTFSLIFITASMIGFSQYKSFLAFDLGFSTENILNIKMQGNTSGLLRTELAKLPEVTAISHSRIITSLGSMQGTQMKYPAVGDSGQVWLNFVDEHYLPLHGHQLVAGRNFAPKAPDAKESEVIVNEQLLKRFNIGKEDLQKAIGEIIEMDNQKMTIIGVLKDFHYGTVESTIEPTALRYSTDEKRGYLNVKIASKDLPSTLSSIESAWKKIDSVHPLEAKFYDDQIEQAYSQFAMISKVIGFLAFLAICVASMGMFGMIVFTTETKLREISIRKVLGAEEKSLIFLLSRGFLALLTISTLIALPLTYIFFDRVVLVFFAYHQPIGALELFSGAAIVMAIAFVMIGSQTLKAARSNPAEVLKTE